MTNPQKIDILPYLAEDVGTGDITAAIIPESTHAEAEVITREELCYVVRRGLRRCLNS